MKMVFMTAYDIESRAETPGPAVATRPVAEEDAEALDWAPLQSLI
jgi:hypothetical protein